MSEVERAMLVLRKDNGPLQQWVLNKSAMTIGRWENNDVVLPDRQVSRTHARIRRQDDTFVLEDCQSKNGTYLNGKVIQQPMPLQDGDEIQIGLGFKLLFVDAESTAPLGGGLGTVGRRGRLHLDAESHRVWIMGQELDPPLSASQFSLLHLLYNHAGNICSREDVVEAVWGTGGGEGVTDQAIDALVRRLRDRLREVDAEYNYVVTVRGHGIRLEVG